MKKSLHQTLRGQDWKQKEWRKKARKESKRERERGDRKKDGGELVVSGRVLRLAIT